MAVVVVKGFNRIDNVGREADSGEGEEDEGTTDAREGGNKVEE